MDLNPFGGNFNVNINEEDKKKAPTLLANTFAFGGEIGALTTSLGFDIMDPFGTKAAMEQQQNSVNQYQAQQDKLMRDEQNRRWQNEISNSWAAYGAQRRSAVMGSATGSGAALAPASANDLYLGGR